MAKLHQIKRELKALTAELLSQNHPNASNEAHRLINLKYGKDWREDCQIEQYKLNPESYRIGKMSYY